MYHRFSKTAKVIISINLVITILLLCMHSYLLVVNHQANQMVYEYMAEKNVPRKSAIRLMAREGIEPELGYGMFASFGMVFTLLSLFFLFLYTRNNSFYLGFMAAVCTLLASLIGGFLMFYLIFSGKTEDYSKRERKNKDDPWGNYIYEKSTLT